MTRELDEATGSDQLLLWLAFVVYVPVMIVVSVVRWVARTACSAARRATHTLARMFGSPTRRTVHIPSQRNGK